MEGRLEEGPHRGQVYVLAGKREGDETSERTMLREAFEEVAIRPTNYKHVGSVEGPILSGKNYKFDVFSINGYDGETSNPGGRLRHIWVPVEEAQRKVTHDLDKQAIGLIMEE